MHRAVLRESAAWDPEQKKLKTPHDLVVSTFRGLALPVDAEPVNGRLALGLLHLQDHLPLHASSPAGWPDTLPLWAAPGALEQRIEWADAMARVHGRGVDARSLADVLLPPGGAAGTRSAIGRAESATQALTLLLASPEFQWR